MGGNVLTPTSEPRFLHISTRADQGVLVLTLHRAALRGEELATAVREELIAAADRSDNPRVVLNLEEVEFVSSLGIRALLLFRRHVRQRGGQLLLCSPAAEVADVLITTRLLGTSQSGLIPFGLAPDVSTAVGWLACPVSDK